MKKIFAQQIFEMRVNQLSRNKFHLKLIEKAGLCERIVYETFSKSIPFTKDLVKVYNNVASQHI